MDGQTDRQRNYSGVGFPHYAPPGKRILYVEKYGSPGKNTPPQMLNANDLLDYLTKRGLKIYEQGCKELDNKALASDFGMTTDQMVVFVKAVSCQAISMGWNKGTKQITTFTNHSETLVDPSKCYGQINKATLKIACERFCKAGEVDAKSCD
jgi:hypothetical protein